MSSADVVMADTSQSSLVAQPQPQLRIGQRIESEGFKGTVRYLGEVHSTKGEWIGVEWDDVERGKHSGEHKGTKYFDCLFPGAGSFTRHSPKINVGSTLVDILNERYVDLEKGSKDLYLGESNIKVDIYDFERVKAYQKKLDLMEIVGLANTNVTSAADPEVTKTTCPAIKDLDLTATLISTWQDVSKICEPLEKLDVLRLSRNRFVTLVGQPSFGESFTRIRCLALNRVFMSWDQFAIIEPSMPNLKILQIGFNRFTELGETDPNTPIALQKVKGLVNLEDLHLEGNLFSDWNQLLRLSHLPKLKTLDLSENKIEKILGPQDENDFRTLVSIRLSDNLINDWLSMDQLGRYVTLKTIWVGNNPVLKTPPQGQPVSGFDPRISCIVRMPFVELLNGSEVTKKNRIDAELYYLKQTALATKGMDDQTIQALHPRFEELCKIHGRPDTSDEFRKATSDILKDRLIEINLVSKDKIDGPVKAAFKRNILGEMTVKNLKNLAQKLVKIPAMRQVLVFQTNDLDYKDVKVDVYLKDDLRQISYYDVKDGEEIIVLDKTKLNK
ncbi:hypothetical protein BGZ76_011039 [Entomortierella beljakovae]|nr:hypothetical protein BGZ76_011039 [Entomortierella beljakovae]